MSRYYRTTSAELCDLQTIQTFANAVKSMTLLEDLSFLSVMPDEIEQWAVLGRSLANCARLHKLKICPREEELREDTTKAFIRELGFPPRLSSRFSLGGDDVIEAFLGVLQSDRAKCLTVLLCGATLERVGTHSTCWRIPREIFRRLHAFLPLYNNWSVPV